MDLTTFCASLEATEPPPVGLSLQALWWDAKGDWAKAHACAQDDPGPTGDVVHAYLHRKEPDLANARYWYNRAGRSVQTVSLAQEWDALTTELLATHGRSQKHERQAEDAGDAHALAPINHLAITGKRTS